MSAIYVPETDLAEKAVYPIFSYETIENIAKSEHAGQPIFEEIEMVSVHIAGERNLVHTARVNEQCGMDGFRRVTWAERFSDEYSAWKDGQAQGVHGTPLSALRDYGITPAQVSLCAARKVHTVEALLQLEGHNLKSLGMDANALKDAARKYVADRSDRHKLASEVEELKAQLAALQKPIADQADEYADMSNQQIKEEIAAIVGAKPIGNPSRDTLISLLNEAKASQ